MVGLCASAEANGVKVDNAELSVNLLSGNTVNLLPPPGHKNTSIFFKGINGLREAWNPALHQQRLNQAKIAEAEGILDVYDLYRERMPWLTEQQAFLLAHGYTVSSAQADNVFQTLSAAAGYIGPIEEGGGLPPSSLDGIIEAASFAYDEEVRELVARIAAGELESPGRVSKRTYEIVSKLDKDALERFMRLCSICIEVNDVKSPERKHYLPMLAHDEGKPTFNEGLLTVIDLRELESAGLLFTRLGESLEVKSRAAVHIGKRMYIVENTGPEPKKLWAGQGVLSSVGTELAEICGVGSLSSLPDLVMTLLQADGMRLVPVVE